MKTIEELEKMTVREIAVHAKHIINYHGYDKAKDILGDYIAVANKKLQAFSTKTNKELGTHRKAPKIFTVTDFFRFR